MNKTIVLTPWQKKQAALLYHFSSLDFLKGVQQRVNALIAFIELALDLAKAQNRDSVLTVKRWGTRNTSENWSNTAWPFLKSYQQSITKDISNRVFEIYGITGTNFCARAMDEFSMAWATPDEEAQFLAMFEEISSYAGKIDDTMDKGGSASRWDDFNLSLAWQELKEQFPNVPKFQVRTDIEGETGKIPVRTGVYVPRDDPQGSLQFAWTGGGRVELLESVTFNSLGLEAFNAVGRKDLWLNGDKMLAFVRANIKDPLLQSDSFFSDSLTPELAPSLVARNAFTSRSCKWYYVELVNGEFEDLEDGSTSVVPPENRLRVEGGQPCLRSGYWFTPAQPGSRRLFKEGENMPVVGSDYGATIWQWDPDQA